MSSFSRSERNSVTYVTLYISGAKPLPPGQFSFNKEQAYQQEIEEEYRILVANENYEAHGAPYWLSDVQREVTHSGESPLFTNRLLATGKVCSTV